MKSTELNDNVLRCMSAQSRKAIGQKTAGEAAAVHELKLERDLHRQIVSDLLRRRSDGERIHWVHSRMDKRTTVAKGWPDFLIILNGGVIGIECKIGQRGLSIDQGAESIRLQHAGGYYFVVKTFEEYRAIILDSWRSHVWL